MSEPSTAPNYVYTAFDAENDGNIVPGHERVEFYERWFEVGACDSVANRLLNVMRRSQEYRAGDRGLIMSAIVWKLGPSGTLGDEAGRPVVSISAPSGPFKDRHFKVNLRVTW